MRFATQQITLFGEITSPVASSAEFTLKTRTGDLFIMCISDVTTFEVVRNLDELNRDRVPEAIPPQGTDEPLRNYLIRKYARAGERAVVLAVAQEHQARTRFEAKRIILLSSGNGSYVFEETHWWLTQITRMADEWLEDLFDSTRSYRIDDFAKFYRTNLNILGEPTDDNVQECATLSRLIYGLSSAFLLTGSERYLLAAQAGVEYERKAFRTLSHDGRYCFWAYGRRKLKDGEVTIVPSQNPDDLDTIPLYEQIYALAGLGQYYRITQDWQVLEDLRRTVNAFNDFYLDEAPAQSKGFPGFGGYFSHLDYATMRPDAEVLGKNQARKNWNSIGDHIPAYLINVILALDPLPILSVPDSTIEEFRDTCLRMLFDMTELIVSKFPDATSRYVNERFYQDWKPDHHWGWQQNRGIIGHNFKIAWNLTRCANFFEFKAAQEKDAHHHYSNKHQLSTKEYLDRRNSALSLARKIADDLKFYGLDPLRGGVFDAVERNPNGGQPLQFVWGSTKDFWQQEQGVLAYLVLYGATHDLQYLELARETLAFWNSFFLDHDNRGIFFRVTESGLPVLQGLYAQKASHAIAGYHAYELNYLAHIYMRAYLVPGTLATPDGADRSFSLFFRPSPNTNQRSLNVLPDFVAPGKVRISKVTIAGVPRAHPDLASFSINLTEQDLGRDVIVEFQALS